MRTIVRPALLNSLALRLIAGALAALMVALLPFFVWQYRREREEHLHAFIDHSKSVGVAIRVGLEDGMLRNDFGALNRMVADLSESEEVDRLMILSRDGTVKVSSEASRLGRRYLPEDPECIGCHRTEPRDRPRYRVMGAAEGGRRFRAVVPIENRPACHRCHGPEARLNGVLVMDLSLAELDAQMSEAGRRMIWAFGATLVLMVLLVGFMLNRLVVRRLARLRLAVDAAGSAGLLEPVPAHQGDEIGVLTEALNRMFRRVGDTLGELGSQRRYLEGLIDSIEDEIMALDSQGRIVMMNRALTKRLGGEKGNRLGRPCFEAALCQHRAGEGCPTLSSFETGKIERYIEHRPASGGGMREMEVHSFPIRGEAGRVIQVVEVARDLSQRADMEAQLHHAERLALVGQLASGVAHEINNPLATITTCVEGLIARMPGQGTEAETAFALDYLETIRRESFRCKNIITNLLEFARRKPPHFDHHDLGAVVEGALGLLGHRARSRGKRITPHLEPGLPKVWVDAEKVTQVVVNLVANALDAVERGGEVQVRLRRDRAAGRVLLEVQDNGCGIAPENRERIFEPFFTTKAPGAGTGLGLSICRDILRQLQGGLEVESRVGEGSLFTAWFPSPDPGGEVRG